MTHKTKGIVLRNVKYGETSLIVTVFTELFGIQSYLINGIRTSGKAGNKAQLYQPGAILQLVVYHSDQKQLQRIKEAAWDYLYQQVLTDVLKNSVALYMVELLQKCLKQPEQHTDLFYFCEDALLQLDAAPPMVTANFALYFTLHLPQFFGFRINDDYSEHNPILDLQEGSFVPDLPLHPQHLQGQPALATSQLLKAMHPTELADIPLNQLTRRHLLLQLSGYYALHIPDFGQMKTLRILQEVLG